MKRGEVWWINFDPSVGGEVKKKRPAVIISNDTSNKYLNRFQVVPLSTNVSKIYPSEAKIRFDGKACKAMCDQLTTVSKLRIINKAGKINEQDMKKIEKSIKIQLDLK